MSMVYSIIPDEEIFFEEQVPDEGQAQASLDLEVEGCLMEVQPLGFYHGRILRVLSSDPNDYLNARYQPGSIISWQPEQ